MSASSTAVVDGGYAQIKGLKIYYETYGTGGVPLVVLHGGLGLTSMFGPVTGLLAAGRRVIAVDLQAHGRTNDTDRPLSYEGMADDIATLVAQLGLEQIDLFGYSLGGGVALRTVIQHPDLVRKLVLVSTPFTRDGWYREMRDGMSGVSSAAFDEMKSTPMYAEYAAVAPDVDAFPTLLDKMGRLLSQPYDWSEAVASLSIPTLLVYGDGDGIPPRHAAEFFALLGGGLRDGGWDGSGLSSSRLAILAGQTHYSIFSAPELAAPVTAFLDA